MSQPAAFISNLETVYDQEHICKSQLRSRLYCGAIVGGSNHTIETDSTDQNRSDLSFLQGSSHRGLSDQTSSDCLSAKENKDNLPRSSDPTCIRENENDDSKSVKESGSSTPKNLASEVAEDSNHILLDENDNVTRVGSPPLYALRRNPKPSKRFKDEDYAWELVDNPGPVFKRRIPMPSTGKHYACTECGKEFPSLKALFGHMRCHPERSWRGIQRPMNVCAPSEEQRAQMADRRKKIKPLPLGIHLENPGLESGSVDTESDAESIEAAYMNGKSLSSFQCWKSGKFRSKRSRQIANTLDLITFDASYELGSSDSPANIKEERDMADCLVMLASAGKSESRKRSQSEKQKTASSSHPNFRRDSDKYLKQKDSARRSSDTNAGIHRSGIKAMGKSGGECSSHCDEPIGNYDHDDETAEQRACKSKYECAACKRIFHSHQALGGHRASHKNVKGCFARTPITGNTAPEITEEQLIGDDSLNRSTEQMHRVSELIPRKGYCQFFDIICKDDGERIETSLTKDHEYPICHSISGSPAQHRHGHKGCQLGRFLSLESSNLLTLCTQHDISNNKLSGNFLDLNLPAPLEDEDTVSED